MDAEVRFSEGVTADHASVFEDDLRSAGLDIIEKVRGVEVETISWLVLISLPMQSFLSSLGEDAYQTLKKAIRDLFKSAGEPESSAVLQDDLSGIQVILESDLPEDAYQQLRGLDLRQFSGVPLRYDRNEHCWRPE
ncbi:hypothetical protein OIE61_14075 [Streptomyces sp. NBC_01762]|uniref:hypothetical protein n=1 Tax=unclassified Streptomyces TaxID=2593676 RepID=UPI002DDB06F4|nr:MULTISPECIES: hypothetical protein [unclassified Streptomyces]WSC44991.1 hypothetical protein OIE61_14075 [Streptomyces sp. NBC_01762]WSD24651.1 hypothetical protein OHA26_14810 [Streptomyces sp. NBC_01751]